MMELEIKSEVKMFAHVQIWVANKKELVENVRTRMWKASVELRLTWCLIFVKQDYVGVRIGLNQNKTIKLIQEYV